MSNIPEDAIIDLSQPGVIHYVYPTGRKPGLMDITKIGGSEDNMSILCKCDRSPLFPRCNRNPDYCPKIAEDKDQDAIWATQISFEE